ncbi:hypothetical protein BX661DRAFT_176048 [Kickxella alabastrina]|uniref:uncharacterized protein n=1 Tax=Kickxella alabastrina TaxID=61397 RepID=UPI00221FD79A|nr:uncharacterized protein BX661DRAFT_176048 [Kickxella alabastrina]KAI7835078.1 hypothetical protein BX661DRAFT_176048 [Kickxella alabastrina]
MKTLVLVPLSWKHHTQLFMHLVLFARVVSNHFQGNPQTTNNIIAYASLECLAQFYFVYHLAAVVFGQKSVISALATADGKVKCP